MADPTDSLWQVVDKVWDMLAANSTFATLVPAANRVKFTDTIDRNPDQDTLADDDYVRVRIQPSDVIPHAYRTSNGSMLTLELRIDMLCGDRRLHLWSEPLIAIYSAFTTWKTHLTGQSWTGTSFNVCQCRLREPIKNDIEQKWGATGWNAVAIAEIDIWYTSTDINGT